MHTCAYFQAKGVHVCDREFKSCIMIGMTDLLSASGPVRPDCGGSSHSILETLHDASSRLLVLFLVLHYKKKKKYLKSFTVVSLQVAETFVLHNDCILIKL